MNKLANIIARRQEKNALNAAEAVNVAEAINDALDKEDVSGPINFVKNVRTNYEASDERLQRTFE